VPRAGVELKPAPNQVPRQLAATWLGRTRPPEALPVALGLLAARQHIPAPSAQQIRYYGWDSNKSRGQRAKTAAAPTRDQHVLELQYVDTDEFATPLALRCCPSGQPVSRCSALAAL